MPRWRTMACLSLIALALSVDVTSGATDRAEPSDEEIGAFAPRRASIKAMVARGFRPTGLEPIYPAQAKCPAISSPFAVMTRGDGSRRAAQFFAGYHGGIDIPVPEGTPVLAMADGVVIYKGEGGSIGGIGLILQHTPADTGLSAWTYTEYKHLMKVPDLEIGQRVRMGDTIALSGKTGTEGRHYGPAGHPHLHLSAFYSEQSGYLSQRFFVPTAGRWMDPLALWLGTLDSDALAALPTDRKRVLIAYVGADGRVNPAGSKIVWPLRCASR